MVVQKNLFAQHAEQAGYNVIKPLVTLLNYFGSKRICIWIVLEAASAMRKKQKDIFRSHRCYAYWHRIAQAYQAICQFTTIAYCVRMCRDRFSPWLLDQKSLFCRSQQKSENLWIRGRHGEIVAVLKDAHGVLQQSIRHIFVNCRNVPVYFRNDCIPLERKTT